VESGNGLHKISAGHQGTGASTRTRDGARTYPAEPEQHHIQAALGECAIGDFEALAQLGGCTRAHTIRITVGLMDCVPEANKLDCHANQTPPPCRKSRTPRRLFTALSSKQFKC
jgi:hypothetical protein